MHSIKNEVNLFVPGRLSLVGELSDWTVEYKNLNKSILPGSSIAIPINKGIYITARKYNKLRYSMDSIMFECEMEEKELEEHATSFEFCSYVCGTCLHMYRRYNVSGIYIDVRYNTLPIKKGLSSSAAICVAVVKSFNSLYNLNLSENEIMIDAYYGEHLALSNCGKLDQIIAKSNNQLSKLVFYEDCVSISPIFVKKELNLVIADLDGNKDTRKMLDTLRNCYPVAQNKKQEAVHSMLGKDNMILVERMERAIKDGNLKEIGKIYTESQNLIDKTGCAISDVYKAPLLHKVMNDKTIKKLSYGSKGIGSGGDGSIQILAKDKDCQKQIIEYLKNKLNMEAFSYTIKNSHKVTKAIIPVAGFATRLYPISRGIRKAFMPINDGKIMKPIILRLVEELDRSGIDEILLVISPEDKDYFDSFFKKSLKPENLKKFDEETKQYELNILRIGEKIKYVYQNEQNGFGHAVYLCKEYIKDDPVLMILGDTYYESLDKEASCVDQILNYYDQVEKNIIGIGKMPRVEIENVGIVNGSWDDKEKTQMTVTKLIEKPKLEYALNKLAMEDGNCYGNFGMWVIDHHVFDQIGENIMNRITSKGEYQFVDAIAQILDDVEIKALKLNGISYDVGNIKSYRRTLVSTINDN